MLLLLLLLSRVSRVRLCATLETAAHQAPLSLGFSRQEHWSGLPFPSPSESEVAQSCSTPSDPIDCSRPGSSIQGIFQTRILEWGAIAFSNKCAIRKKIIQPKSYSFPFCFHRIHSLLGLVLSYLKSVRSSGLRKTAKIRETKLSRQAVKPRRF